MSSGIVEAYPPLCDAKGSYTAQFEHVRDYSHSTCYVLSVSNIMLDNSTSTNGQGGYQSRR